jgi:hypothetical protein
MQDCPTPVDLLFEEWTRLTDEYAEQFLLLQRGMASARSEVRRLSSEIQRLDREIFGATQLH